MQAKTDIIHTQKESYIKLSFSAKEARTLPQDEIQNRIKRALIDAVPEFIDSIWKKYRT